jgi:glycosyltransferase involved in cell wall biosynthesis
MDLPVLIPAFRPPAALLDTVRALHARSAPPVVVVDDGSGRAFSPIFRAVAAVPRVTLLAHPENMGKGSALRTGIEHVLRAGLSAPGLVTADADGQHAVEDILRIRETLRRRPDALVLGARVFDATVPLPNRLGNRLARWLLRRVGGPGLGDTQTGLRGIPLDCLPGLVALRSTGYEFEMEMLLEAHAHGLRVLECPIRTIYGEGHRSSHFKPVRDSARIALLIARHALAGRADVAPAAVVGAP